MTTTRLTKKQREDLNRLNRAKTVEDRLRFLLSVIHRVENKLDSVCAKESDLNLTEDHELDVLRSPEKYSTIDVLRALIAGVLCVDYSLDDFARQYYEDQGPHCADGHYQPGGPKMASDSTPLTPY